MKKYVTQANNKLYEVKVEKTVKKTALRAVGLVVSAAATIPLIPADAYKKSHKS